MTRERVGMLGFYWVGLQFGFCWVGLLSCILMSHEDDRMNEFARIFVGYSWFCYFLVRIL